MISKSQYRIGDLVRYVPTDRTRGWDHEDAIFGLKSGRVYRVAEVRDGGYLCFYENHEGSHFSNFEPAGPDSESELEIAIPYPTQKERVELRLQRAGWKVGDKVVFKATESNRRVLAAIGELRLIEGGSYTVTGFDAEALGCYLLEIPGAFLGNECGGGFPLGWFVHDTSGVAENSGNQ